MELDSRVAFQSRVVELEFGELSRKFTDINWDAYAKLGFAVPSSVPGVVEENVLERQVLAKHPVIPEDQDMPVQATLVRRFCTSHTSSSSVVCPKFERAEDDARKRMPHAEREECKDRLRTKLAPGLVPEKALEPSIISLTESSTPSASRRRMTLLFIIHVPTESPKRIPKRSRRSRRSPQVKVTRGLDVIGSPRRSSVEVGRYREDQHGPCAKWHAHSRSVVKF